MPVPDAGLVGYIHKRLAPWEGIVGPHGRVHVLREYGKRGGRQPEGG